MSARAKESQIAGGGRRESAELSHKRKQDWVWQVPRVKQRREKASASHTVKNGRDVPRGREPLWCLV